MGAVPQVQSNLQQASGRGQTDSTMRKARRPKRRGKVSGKPARAERDFVDHFATAISNYRQASGVRSTDGLS